MKAVLIPGDGIGKEKTMIQYGGLLNAIKELGGDF